MERTDELRLKQSRIWLKSAKRDYRTYSMEIHTLFFPLIRLTPEEPQDAIYHLAQCVEKLVKATCVSSGLYSEDEVISYGHDTLYLYLDFILKLMDNPLCQLFFDKTEGKIFEQSNAELPNYSEAIRRVIEIQRNAKLESSRKEMREWAWEYATLPKKLIKIMSKAQRKGLRTARILAKALHLIPAKLVRNSPTSGHATYSMLLSSLKKRGFLLSDKLEQFIQSEEISSFLKDIPQEKKSSLINQLGDVLVIGFLFSALLIIVMITYAHENAPRYPIKHSATEHKLDSESYDSSLGLAGSLIEVGDLTHDVMKTLEAAIPNFYSDISRFNDLVKNSFTKSG